MKTRHIAAIGAVDLETSRIRGQVDSTISRLRKRQALRSRAGTAEPISGPDQLSGQQEMTSPAVTREGTAEPILNPDPDPIMECRETVTPKTFIIAVQENSPHVVAQVIKKTVQMPGRHTFTAMEDVQAMEAKDRFDDVAHGLRVPSVFLPNVIPQKAKREAVDQVAGVEVTSLVQDEGPVMLGDGGDEDPVPAAWITRGPRRMAP